MRPGTIVALLVIMSAAPIGQEAAVRQQLVPTGRLRVGLNAGNPLTRSFGADLSRELARRFGVDAVFVEYPTPGAVTEAAGTAWDIAFVAADPDRVGAVAFTPPYVEIEATYLVRGDSPVRSTGDIDRVGMRVATGTTSAYTLVLKREIQHAELVLVSNDEAVRMLAAGKVDAAAGLRFNLVAAASRVPGSRVLADSFTTAQQAIAVPSGHTAALAYLAAFVDEMKRSGFIADAIAKSGFAGARVASGGTR
jgi:polar amino acid transport system substrate-binding protein